ncbi:MAG: hypothetical protein CVU43_02895 [Chloroflexi bacterium HGW-Chloroflexi-5]|jgi:hypothetical protein|nr:MAG: hypothetical protein CVU43_02895 [Chloroflexi bacterium HGW-Chloroflexi-5]
MKKLLISIFILLILSACERPATISSWSPINDVNTPAPTSSPTAKSSTIQPTPTTPIKILKSATPLPTLNLDKFPDPLPEAVKGYELVSWQSGSDWNFTLITGTNRSKSFDELMSPDSQVTADGFVKITVSGIDKIKQVLAMLPAQTEVFWTGMDLSGSVPEGTLYFSYPDKIIKDELINFSAKQDVKLNVLVEPGK